MSEDPQPSVELTPHAEFVVGELKGTVDSQGKQLDKLEYNFGELQVSIANQFESLSEAGASREETILKCIDDQSETSELKWKQALKSDQDEREKIAEKKAEKKEQYIAEKKKFRNKILVVVLSSLIISAIGFSAMIIWLGAKAYLKQELTITEMKQEIKENGKR